MYGTSLCYMLVIMVSMSNHVPFFLYRYMSWPVIYRQAGGASHGMLADVYDGTNWKAFENDPVMRLDDG